MLSIILIDDNAQQQQRDDAISAIPHSANSELLLVSAAPAPRTMSRAKFFAGKGDTLASAVECAMNAARGETVVMISTRIAFAPGEIEKLLQSASSQGAHAAQFFTLSSATGYLDAPATAPDQIIASLIDNDSSAQAVIAVRKQTAQTLGISGSSTAAIIAGLALKLIGTHESTMICPEDIRLTGDSGVELSSREKSTMLKAATDLCNVEELFPLHDWSGHSHESAAVCYQLLAAMFLRYGDPTLALASLKNSDKFEDSPRSLALKGLIAMKNGETLGAVANMVSSLKQYEIRKKENAGHYISFAPRNLEVINSSLNAGLAALNQHENALALEHFATAVFQFDSFYEECGLDSLKAISH